MPAFPKFQLLPQSNRGAATIGVARVADSRTSRDSGRFNEVTVLVGPELPDHIERQFRSELVEEGFSPIEALSPNPTNSCDCKTILVTLQSVSIACSGTFTTTGDASADIAVQVYAPKSHSIVFAQSYSGRHSEGLSARELGMNSGRLIAAATDDAVDHAFEDKAFREALR
jgi:hypothetical protein